MCIDFKSVVKMLPTLFFLWYSPLRQLLPLLVRGKDYGRNSNTIVLPRSNRFFARAQTTTVPRNEKTRCHWYWPHHSINNRSTWISRVVRTARTRGSLWLVRTCTKTLVDDVRSTKENFVLARLKYGTRGWRVDASMDATWSMFWRRELDIESKDALLESSGWCQRCASFWRVCAGWRKNVASTRRKPWWEDDDHNLTKEISYVRVHFRGASILIHSAIF